MRTTRRLWATAAVGVIYTGVAVIAVQPLALIGTVGVGAWLLGTALAATVSFQTLAEELTITYELEAETTQVESTTTATLSVSRPPEAADTVVSLSPSIPAGLTTTATSRTLVLDKGETEATTTFPLQTDVAGTFTLSAPDLTVIGVAGLYTAHFERGPTPTVTVLPQTPTVHIGKGGQPYGNAFGEHETDRPGPGIAVRELRQYITGEDAMNIDWKSTARLGEPYVRETEGETDRKTVLVVDHRAQTGHRDSEVAPLEYAREAALALTTGAIQNNDPLSLWTVGDEGLSTRITAGSDPNTYNRIRSALFDLAPTTGTPATRPHRRGKTTVPEQLPAESTFANTLRQYTERDATLGTATVENGLTGAIKQVRSEMGSDAWVVLITTDDDPTQLREAIQLATQGGVEVCVLVMPTTLFEPEGLGTITQTYEQYIQFEELRRELDAHPRVVALELAPGDRLSGVLSARQQIETQRGA